MAGGFLRRQTNYPGGISAGGGDSDWDRCAQPTLLTKKISSTTTFTTHLPAGTVIWDIVVMPDPDALATAGTVTITNTTDSVLLASGLSLAVASRSAVETPIQVVADTVFTFVAASMVAATAAYVGFIVTLPRTRD